MKPTTQNNSPVETGNIAQVESFKIAVNGKAFKILLDGIYPNKIKAVIRELCTNAFDAHVAAGKRDIPFRVTLPTNFDHTFSVRDYGTSLTHEQVFKLYSTLFESSKENSNAEVGMLGLGSKSPFAYVDAFTTTAWMNGEKRTYRAFMDQDGVPKIVLLGTEASDEPQGLEVTIATNARDVATFRDTARDILMWFPVRPTIVGQNIQFPEMTKTIEGKGWYITDSHTRARARQGCVVYPIAPDAIPGLTADQKAILASPLVIDFPIGTLDVAPSREELSYGPATCSNIVARLNSIAQEVTDKYGQEITQAPTLWEAGKVYFKIASSGMADCILKMISKVQWNGKAVGEEVHIRDVLKKLEAPGPNGEKGITTGLKVFYFDYWRVGRCQSLNLDGRALTEALKHRFTYGEDMVFLARIGDEKPSYEGLRLRNAVPDDHGACFIVAETKEALVAFLKAVGDPPCTLTCDLPQPTIARTKSTSVPTGKTKKDQIKARVWRYQGSISNLETVVDLSGNAYFIPTRSGRLDMPRTRSHPVESSEVYSGLAAAVELGIADKDFPVYFVNPTYISRVQEFGKWTNLIELVEAKIPTFRDGYQAGRIHDKRREVVSYPVMREVIRHAGMRDRLAKYGKGPLFEYMKAYDTLRDSVENPQDSNAGVKSAREWHTLSLLGNFTTLMWENRTQWDKEDVTDPLLEEYNRKAAGLTSRYKMLEKLGYYSIDSDVTMEYIQAIDFLREHQSKAAMKIAAE